MARAVAPQLLLALAADHVAQQEVDVGAGQRVVRRAPAAASDARLRTRRGGQHALDVHEPGAGDEDLAAPGQARTRACAARRAPSARGKSAGGHDHVEPARVEIALDGVAPARVGDLDQLAERLRLPGAASASRAAGAAAPRARRVPVAAAAPARPARPRARAPLPSALRRAHRDGRCRAMRRVSSAAVSRRDPRAQVPIGQRSPWRASVSRNRATISGGSAAPIQRVGLEQGRAAPAAGRARPVRQQTIERRLLRAEDAHGPASRPPSRPRARDGRGPDPCSSSRICWNTGVAMEQTDDAVALALQELEPVVHAAQLGAALHALHVHLGDPRRAWTVGARPPGRRPPQGQVAVALGGAPLLGDPLALLDRRRPARGCRCSASRASASSRL